MKLLSYCRLIVLGACVMLALSGCGTSNLTQKPSGFLPDYSLLKPVANPPSGAQIYTYSDPTFIAGTYNAVIVAPVLLYETATENGITDQQIQSAQMNIQNGIIQIVSQKAPIVDKPGPGVVKLSVAITGAEIQKAGLEPWNIIPISAAIKLASMATNTNSKTPMLVVELKFTDSVSGKLLRETVTVLRGESFRGRVDTAQEFQQLAQTWVQLALQYSETQGQSIN